MPFPELCRENVAIRAVDMRLVRLGAGPVGLSHRWFGAPMELGPSREAEIVSPRQGLSCGAGYPGFRCAPPWAKIVAPLRGWPGCVHVAMGGKWNRLPVAGTSTIFFKFRVKRLTWTSHSQTGNFRPLRAWLPCGDRPLTGVRGSVPFRGSSAKNAQDFVRKGLRKNGMGPRVPVPAFFRTFPLQNA